MLRPAMRILKRTIQMLGWVLLVLGVLTLPVVLTTLGDSVAGWLHWFTTSEQFFIRLMGGGGVGVSVSYIVITVIGLLLIYLPREPRVPQPPRRPEEEERRGDVAPTVRLRQLEPRAIYVERRADGGYDEHTDRPEINRLRFATVASFRSEPVAGAVDVFAHARITFYDNGDELQRIDDGCWLGAAFDHAEMPVGATREVIVLIGNGGEPRAIQDNRRDAGHPRDPTPRGFERRPSTAVMELILSDRRDDAILANLRYRYRLSFAPAGIFIA